LDSTAVPLHVITPSIQ